MRMDGSPFDVVVFIVLAIGMPLGTFFLGWTFCEEKWRKRGKRILAHCNASTKLDLSRAEYMVKEEDKYAP
jgi:hypothetical protein